MFSAGIRPERALKSYKKSSCCSSTLSSRMKNVRRTSAPLMANILIFSRRSPHFPSASAHSSSNSQCPTIAVIFSMTSNLAFSRSVKGRTVYRSFLVDGAALHNGIWRDVTKITETLWCAKKQPQTGPIWDNRTLGLEYLKCVRTARCPNLLKHHRAGCDPIRLPCRPGRSGKALSRFLRKEIS